MLTINSVLETSVEYLLNFFEINFSSFSAIIADIYLATAILCTALFYPVLIKSNNYKNVRIKRVITENFPVFSLIMFFYCYLIFKQYNVALLKIIVLNGLVSFNCYFRVYVAKLF